MGAVTASAARPAGSGAAVGVRAIVRPVALSAYAGGAPGGRRRG
ncbi:hypothetical protein ACWGQ9_02620 [Streptomyces parvus]